MFYCIKTFFFFNENKALYQISCKFEVTCSNLILFIVIHYNMGCYIKQEPMVLILSSGTWCPSICPGKAGILDICSFYLDYMYKYSF